MLHADARIGGVLLMAALFLTAPAAHADNVIPPPPELPATLTLDDALKMFHQRGLDLLLADANTRMSEGQLRAAGAVQNPVLSGSVGESFTYSNTNYSKNNCYANGAQCSPWIFNVGISDSAAIDDIVTGKRDLRMRVARNALAAAKLGRVDAERTIALQVKAAYVQIAQSALTYKFAKEVAAIQVTTLKRAQDRYRGGATNEGDLQRIEVQKLEADQASDQAAAQLRQARVALAFLLGVRGEVPDFDVDTKVLDYAVPKGLHDTSEVSLLRNAFESRPDLVSLGYSKQQAEAQIALVKRQRWPGLTFGANYAWGGYGGLSTNGPIQAPTVSFNISAPLPIFYNLQGEQRQAYAQYDQASLQQAKLTSQVVNDVATAFSAFTSTKSLVERMEGPRREGGGLLQSARGAFEIVSDQYGKGAAPLTDYLDALRTYIATKNEYFDDLTNYWTAVFQLEAAVARDLR